MAEHDACIKFKIGDVPQTNLCAQVVEASDEFDRIDSLQELLLMCLDCLKSGRYPQSTLLLKTYLEDAECGFDNLTLALKRIRALVGVCGRGE